MCDTPMQDGAIGPLSQLSELRRLELGGNCLAGFEGVEGVLRGLPRLVHLDLRGNPLCRAPKYREQVCESAGCFQQQRRTQPIHNHRQRRLCYSPRRLNVCL